MPHDKLHDAWLMRQRAVPISPVLHFAPEGLVLGARTVVVAANSPRWLRSLEGQEARVLGLLAAAYGKTITPAVLGNIKRAVKAWNEGDDCLAYVHLAHARLGETPDPRDAAYRLFIVDSFMKAGTSPREVFAALGLSAPYVDAVEKLFNSDEPRVPAGSGKQSGEWTDSEESSEDVAGSETARAGAPRLSLLENAPPPSARFLGTLDAAQLVELGVYVARFATVVGAAAAAFGLLFIPSSNDVRVEGEIPGVPGLKYWRNRDESIFHLTYDAPDGGRQTFAAYFDGDELRDDHSKVIGRVLPDGGVLIQSAAVSPALVKDDEPRLCPAEGPDKKNELGLKYEAYVKSFVNPPPNTTPTGIGFQPPNPKSSDDLVHYDDCRRTTGMMAEAKGSGYDGLLATSKSPYVPEWTGVIREWWGEAGRQIAASDGRPVRWYFADLASARFARELFDSDIEDGRQRIEVVFLPWSWRSR